jgi:hypothetical protein
MGFHGNSKKNEKLNHLYLIFDKFENDVFKYGISADPIEADGLSERTKEQITQMNLAAGWDRYIARVIKTHIPGRTSALELEDEHILQFLEKNGRQPRGNRKKVKRKK